MSDLNMSNKEKISSTNQIAINVIFLISFIIGVSYLVLLFGILSSNKINTADIIAFIKIFELILVLLAISSCILCYESTNKEELFILSLFYIIFFIDVLLGNVDNMSLDASTINISNYLIVENSIFRLIILIFSLSSFRKMKKIIMKNRIKSILITVVIATSFGLLKQHDILFTTFNDVAGFVTYNIVLTIFYGTVSVIYLKKSLDRSEYIYSVISASIFFFMLKAIYAVVGATKALANVKLLSISITYIGFIILLGGIICELLLSIRKNKELENELTVFKKIADESRYSCILIYDEYKNLKYINSVAKQYYRIKEDITCEDINKKLIYENQGISKEKEKEIKDHFLQIGYWKGKIDIEETGVTISCSVQKIYMGDMKNVVVIFNDITDKIRTKRSLIEYEKMKNQEQVRNEFFANISHELRTPLNIFYSTIQLLDLKNKTNPEKFNEIYSSHKQCLKTNCQRMLRLINNIVDITKIDVGFIKPKFVNSDIVSLVENITLSVVNYAQHKKINIVFDTEIEEKIIKCDEDMMERAMLNLLSNAIKFTKQNGNVLVNMYADEKWIHIIVKDDGMGIPIEMQGTIFERFVQNDKSLTRLNEGSGIGLSIVQSAVKLNEGEIYLDSDGKNGTEFEILLPNKKLEGEDLDDRIYKVDVSNIELELSDIYELYI
ncbi:sensor histidine kinase [Romboutsia lituseburensis]|uniref:sensor histidine kinase n=1 Tax=Romboutsia lituseburensis TaxID=1537 RepID=UPI0022EA1397|nr:HAMP domain-containing sensor histidine kinase [Romboutsia lituseburensis]